MKRTAIRLATLAILLGVALLASAQEPVTSILWAGTSVEHDALTIQAYSVARVMLDRALVNHAWTAAIEQQGHAFQTLPPAIVMDIDETIVDNSPFEASLAVGAGAYSDTKWTTWVNAARAEALPGAVEFTKYARSRGVTIFYVTNRSAAEKKGTRANLEHDGFPLDANTDTLLCKGEKPEWTSDKSSRRAEVAKRYRILLLFGDDLGDFMPGAVDTVQKRLELAARYSDRWGTKWIVLPNAMYGSWETAILNSFTGAAPQSAKDVEVQAMKQLAAPAVAAPPSQR
jgi:5'-nucleotidase (lipoprotein e(P4) family)